MSGVSTLPYIGKYRGNGLLEMIRQFTPNWFAVTMGIGVVYLVLMALPGESNVRSALAQTLWLLDIGLFAVFSLMFAARCLLFGETIRATLRDPMQLLLYKNQFFHSSTFPSCRHPLFQQSNHID